MPELAALGTLGFGAANLGNLYREVSDEQAWAALDAAWAAGIRYYDTAPHYGLGLSERRLGAFLATKPRAEFVLSTKVGRLLRPNPGHGGELDLANDFAVPADVKRVWDFTAEGIRTSLDESLQRLGLDRVDVLYLHDPDKHDLDAADREAYPAMIALRDEGRVDAVGAGSMSVDALTRAARTEGLDLLMVAGRLTLAEQPAAAQVVPAALDNGIRIVAAGVYNSGLLATNAPSADGRYEYGGVPPALLAHVQQIAAICAKHGVELPVAALQYTLRIKPVVSVVFGSAKPEQVAQTASRAAEPVPEELWTELAAAGLIP
ncbi:MAG: aldo/keto reductase [Rhodoglobus sp.]|nr:aldo/keto reductase [Rhodoglobus sp.]